MVCPCSLAVLSLLSAANRIENIMLVLSYSTEIGLRNCAAICFLFFCIAGSIFQAAAQPTIFRSYNPNARKGMTQRFLEDVDKITVLIEKDSRNVALYKQRAQFYKNLLELNFDNNDEIIYADKFEADLLRIIDLEKTARNYAWGGSWFSYRLKESPPPEKIGELYPSNQYLDKAVSNFLNSIRLDSKPDNVSGTYGQLSELYRTRPQKLLSSPNFHQWQSKIPLKLVINDLDNSITHRRKSFEIGAEFPAADQLKALLSETYRTNAETAFKLGEYKTALNFYEAGQKFLSSEYSQCYYYAGWGNVYLKLNDPDRAIELFGTVPKTADPKCVELFTNRRQCLFFERRF